MTNVYATVEDVAEVWDGVIRSGGEPRIQKLLTYAHALLRAKASSLDAKVISGAVDIDLLQMVIVNAVIRVLNNPKGVLGAGTGETNFYYSQAGADRYGGITIDDADLDVLGLGGKSITKIASFRMSSPYAVIHDQPWRC